MLSRMFHLARRAGQLNVLPFFPKLKEAAARSGFFEPEQYEKLLSALPEYLRPVLALGYFCGLRRGEVLALEWTQIDFLAGTIRLRAGETKNNEGRLIPIVPQLRAILLERYAKRQAGCPYVCFRLDQRGIAVKIRAFRKAWQSACIKLGLGRLEPVINSVNGEILRSKPRSDRLNARPQVKMRYHGLLYHDLRRSAVRSLVRSQVPEVVARAITGHKTRSVFDRYNIVSERDLAEAGEKLAAYLENGHKTGTIEPQGSGGGRVIN
jgi:integrase